MGACTFGEQGTFLDGSTGQGNMHYPRRENSKKTSLMSDQFRTNLGFFGRLVIYLSNVEYWVGFGTVS